MADTSTKPRVPIAATYASPGPVYGLPTLVGKKKHDPRSVHACAPAHVFGLKAEAGANDSSPGPIYLPDSKLMRTGRQEGPRAAIASRPREPSAFETPGPSLGLDAEGKAGGPAYSFGAKPGQGKANDTPAPNRYMVPSTLGRTVQSNVKQAPSYSVKSRAKPDKEQTVPGPGAYKTVDPKEYKKSPPKYSISGRTEPPGDSTHKPGPGSHYPENVHVDKRAPPKFSFGVKHSPYMVPLIIPD